MQEFLREDPIVASATNLDRTSALAVIRLSSPTRFDLNGFFSKPFSEFSARSAHLVKIFDPSLKDTTLDEALVTFFPAPHSFTGENVIEISCHGNPVNVQRIIDCLVGQFNFQHAFPGEFSYRALKNKKLSPNQVEGLDLLLNSTSELGISAGLSALNGELNLEYLELRNLFLDLKAKLELNLDFSEDIGEEEGTKLFSAAFQKFQAFLSSLYQRTLIPPSLAMAPEIVLGGNPNAGKSTLFNFFLQKDRAIINAAAGTTRDYLSEHYQVQGRLFRLIDTAGIRDTSEEIEKDGIERAIEIWKRGFFKILVVNPLSTVAEGYFGIDADAIIYTHLDEFSGSIGALSQPQFLSGPIGADSFFRAGPMGAGSGIGPIGPGKAGLEKLILDKLDSIKNIDKPIFFERHKILIEKAYQLQIEIAVEVSHNDFGILSQFMIELEQIFDGLIGQVLPDTVLNDIFDNFCIGK